MSKSDVAIKQQYPENPPWHGLGLDGIPTYRFPLSDGILRIYQRADGTWKAYHTDSKDVINVENPKDEAGLGELPAKGFK